MAYVLRFIKKLRGKSQQPSHLTADELKLKLTKIVVKIQQQLDFGHEVKLLKNKRPLDPKSKLQALNPFLDSDGVLLDFWHTKFLKEIFKGMYCRHTVQERDVQSTDGKFNG